MEHDRSTPDWVMLGVPTPDGRVAIYASKELNQAELSHETEFDVDIYGWYRPPIRNPHTRIELTVEMRTYVIVTADSYQEAFQRLFNHWSPETARTAIDPSMKAISS